MSLCSPDRHGVTWPTDIRPAANILKVIGSLDISSLIGILIIVLNFTRELDYPMITEKSLASPPCHESETRCECGQLIAKVRGQGLELKCKRCKRIVVIPFTSIEGWAPSQYDSI